MDTEVVPFEEKDYDTPYDEKEIEIRYANYLKTKDKNEFNPKQYYSNREICPALHISPDTNSESEDSDEEGEEKEVTFSHEIEIKEIEPQEGFKDPEEGEDVEGKRATEDKEKEGMEEDMVPKDKESSEYGDVAVSNFSLVQNVIWSKNWNQTRSKSTKRGSAKEDTNSSPQLPIIYEED